MIIKQVESENYITLQNFSEVKIISLVGQTTIDHFKVLLQRALNTWDAAPHEFKSLVDLFIHGRELQDYKNLAGAKSINDPLK